MCTLIVSNVQESGVDEILTSRPSHFLSPGMR
jgi:hypothetical protein